jgi:dephospho-CoA kinase
MSSAGVNAIKETWRDNFENNILNRSMLAEIVFANPDKLKVLNAIVHPAVKHFKEWLLEQAAFLFSCL